MKESKFSQDEKELLAGGVRSLTAETLTADETAFAPSPDEVARRAYFCYENQGSLPGHDVQHWLAAEAELIAERNRTRTHGFHNKT